MRSVHFCGKNRVRYAFVYSYVGVKCKGKVKKYLIDNKKKSVIC